MFRTKSKDITAVMSCRVTYVERYTQYLKFPLTFNINWKGQNTLYEAPGMSNINVLITR